MITETWFTDKQADDDLKIDGFVLFRRDRMKRKGGGLCMYVKSNIVCTV
jgi:hypothetical protein